MPASASAWNSPRKVRSTPTSSCRCPTRRAGGIGYARQSGLPFELGIIRNHYVGCIIEPVDNIRHPGVRLKHNANRALIEGSGDPVDD
jgi:glutamine phosphoribosylpyrophosphate amidotransferase